MEQQIVLQMPSEPQRKTYTGECFKCRKQIKFLCVGKVPRQQNQKSNNGSASFCLECTLRKTSVIYKPLKHLIEPWVVHPSSLIGETKQLYYINRPETKAPERLCNRNKTKTRVISSQMQIIEEQNTSKQEQLAFALVCSDSISSSTGQTLMWPEGDIKIQVNGETVYLKNRQDFYVCSPSMKQKGGETQIVVELDVSQLKCACYFVIFTVYKKTSIVQNNVAQILRLKISQQENSAKLQNIYQKTLLNHSKLYFSVCCPFNLSPMQTPVRMTKCRHAQCFDLESVLNYLELGLLHQNRICCPICRNRGVFQNLYIDTVQITVINRLKEELRSNGHLMMNEFLVCMSNPEDLTEYSLKKISSNGEEMLFNNRSILQRF